MFKYTEYKKHGRVVELELCLLHNSFVKNFGVDRAYSIFKTISDAFDLNWTFIVSILNRKDAVFQSRFLNRKRFLQEILFIAYLNDEALRVALRKYSFLNRNAIFKIGKEAYDVESFISEEWLEKLDYSIVVAGVDAYRLEGYRFLLSMKSLKDVL